MVTRSACRAIRKTWEAGIIGKTVMGVTSFLKVQAATGRLKFVMYIFSAKDAMGLG